jgi:hypothetical protein
MHGEEPSLSLQTGLLLLASVDARREDDGASSVRTTALKCMPESRRSALRFPACFNSFPATNECNALPAPATL